MSPLVSPPIDIMATLEIQHEIGMQNSNSLIQQQQADITAQGSVIDQLQAPVMDEQITIAELSPPLPSFRFFSKLPLEIRLMIWKLMIPPSRMILVDVFDYRDPSSQRVVRHSRPSPRSVVRHIRPESIFCIYRAHGGGRASGLGFRKFAEIDRTLITRITPNEDAFRNHPLPAITAVCQESRAVSVKIYDFCLNTYLNPQSTVMHRRPLCGRGRPPTMKVTSHSHLLSPGVRFRPLCDVVCLFGADSWNALKAAREDELNTATIFRVAVRIEGFRALLPLFDQQTPHFRHLQEILIIARPVNTTGILWIYHKPCVYARMEAAEAVKEYNQKAGRICTFPSFSVEPDFLMF